MFRDSLFPFLNTQPKVEQQNIPIKRYHNPILRQVPKDHSSFMQLSNSNNNLSNEIDYLLFLNIFENLQRKPVKLLAYQVNIGWRIEGFY